MYPHYLTGLVWRGGGFKVSEEQILSVLLGSDPGTFAFFQINKAQMNRDHLGRKTTPVTYEAALGQAHGNADLAKIMMVTGKKNQVGLAFVDPQKKIIRIIMDCRLMLQRFQSYEQLITKLKSDFPIDAQKLLYPGMNYIPDLGDDD